MTKIYILIENIYDEKEKHWLTYKPNLYVYLSEDKAKFALMMAQKCQSERENYSLHTIGLNLHDVNL
jgi:hypothetical protein